MELTEIQNKIQEHAACDFMQCGSGSWATVTNAKFGAKCDTGSH
jgi:hypothetical protein